ncbi:MAG: sensor histidine kinase [Caldilineaceae bacterium]
MAICCYWWCWLLLRSRSSRPTSELQRIVQPLEQLNRAVNVLGEGNFEAVQKQVAGVQEIEELQQALSHMATQLQRYQQELQSYIDAMTMAQEEERKRLARELHDETVQALIALNQQVEMVEHRLEDDPPQAVERLRTLRPLISGAISGIRRQIQDLRPLYLEDLGFVSALEMLVQQAAARHDIVGDFEVIGDPGVVLPPALEISGYRIVQEALKNVAGHAQATWGHVELIFEDEAVVVRIEDDGIGFDAHTRLHDLAQDGHYGLLGMNERARLHGGEIHVESTPGQGTIVMARLKVEV